MTSLAVRVPIANLRREPGTYLPSCDHDDLQETQLLFNEKVILTGEQSGWFSVEATEQPKFDSSSRIWRGYPGWLEKEDVLPSREADHWDAVVAVRETVVYQTPAESAPVLTSVVMGTRFSCPSDRGEQPYCEVILPDGSAGYIRSCHLRMRDETITTGQAVRRAAWATGLHVLGIPYLWGGRSLPCERRVDPGERGLPFHRLPALTGVDCSGLVNLIFRVHGVDLPRDAHDQWQWVAAVDAGALEPGDLVFLSKQKCFDTMDHVMMYGGGDDILEAPETGQAVRRTTFAGKLGLSSDELRRCGQVAGERKVFFGRPGPL